MAGKVTVGRALHWPRVADQILFKTIGVINRLLTYLLIYYLLTSVVYPPTGSMVYGKEMSTRPTLL